MSRAHRHCPSCGAALRGRFCSDCGRRADEPGAAGDRIPWPAVIGTTVIIVLFGLFVFWRNDPAPAAPPVVATQAQATAAVPSAAPVSPPDLSTLTPRERFDRLFDQVMRADENGDTATVTTFAPMALAAFALLGTPDIDARFHAALIRLAIGDLTGAQAEAKAIAAEQPRHLFAMVIDGRIAALDRDDAALTAAHQAFLAAYPSETALARPEYPGHQAVLDQFLKEATP